MSLYDFDTLIRLGNLCRHTLDGSAVGSNKATAHWPKDFPEHVPCHELKGIP